MGNINITVNVNNASAQNEGKGKQEERQPIDRTNEKLIDNSTSFSELLNILRRSPAAVEAEKSEIEEKMAEAKEARLRRLYGVDYEFIQGEDDTMLTKEKRRPGAAQLRKFVPRVAKLNIGSEGSCEVYVNGYAIYDNGDRKTVLWVPDCGSVTYYFTPLKDTEKAYLKQKDEIGEDVLGPAPWYIALTMAGEDSIERNLVHPKSKGSASDADDPREWEGLPDGRSVGGTHFDTPEEYVLRKEAEEERRKALTQKQREAYELYYERGWTQEEIADELGISQKAVAFRLDAALMKFNKDPEKFFM